MEVETGKALDKSEVHDLLWVYGEDLREALSAPGCTQAIDAAARAARRNRENSRPGNIPWENTLVGQLLVPVLHDTIGRTLRIDHEQARSLVFSENRASRKTHAAPFSPSRSLSHPFGKGIGADVATIATSWRTTDKKKVGLAPACPDFALGQPYGVVFEAKYYRPQNGNVEAARRALVEGIYQAFFYRALPLAPAKKSGAPPWHYQYAAFVAVDTSPGHALLQAWQELRNDVKTSFWDSANIFVLIRAPGSSCP